MRLILIPLLILLPLGACKSREEKLKAAQQKGQDLVETKARLVKGVGEGLQGGGKAGAEAVSKGVGEVVKGVSKGFDASLQSVAVKVVPELGARGLQVTRATRKDRTVSVYVITDKAFSGPLILRALDDKGVEVGRAKVALKGEAGDAAYTDFPFDERTPMSAVQGFELR